MAKAATNGSAPPPAAASAIARLTPEQKAKNDERSAALQSALGQIEKDHGKGSIMKFNDLYTSREVQVIPSGALSIDHALGIGGFPRGRIVEIFGPESSGKTTLALSVVAQAQKLGGIAAYVDAEHAMDPLYCRKIGVNLDELLISQPDNGEQALDIVETLVRSNSVDVIVVDSVAALVPKAEIDGEMGDSFVGLQARLMSQAMRKLTGAINRSKCLVIFINQLREKIGVMFGNPETTTGGRALKFYCSMRCEVRRIASIKERDQDIGNRVRFKVVKNKLAPPFRESEFDLMFGEGISAVGDLVDLGLRFGVIDKAGAWFSADGQKLGQGRENTKQYLKERPELFAKLEAKARVAMGLVPDGSGKIAATNARPGEAAASADDDEPDDLDA